MDHAAVANLANGAAAGGAMPRPMTPDVPVGRLADAASGASAALDVLAPVPGHGPAPAPVPGDAVALAAAARTSPALSSAVRMLLGRVANALGVGQRRPLLEAITDVAEALLSERGEASGVALATELLAGYAALAPAARAAFLVRLANRFDADPARLAAAWRAYEAAPGPLTARRLHAASEPRRQELIRRMNLAPGGTAALVAMRVDLLRVLRERRGDKELESVEADFQHLFASWFNRGFLGLRRIDWSTPPHILERIIRYEAVHAIDSWDDLRRRVHPQDRRCFAFFHPSLPDDPLIFVEVALTDGIPRGIAPLLAADRTELPARRASTAVFYSISNCQPGLKGVSFGHFLIKQVVEELRREFPRLQTFVTLSPVPGLRRWLASPDGIEATRSVACPDGLDALLTPGWAVSPPASLLASLHRAALHYLAEAKDGSARPLDSVARFHLGNGARLDRLHALADVSAKGLAENAGFMVNYLYEERSLERQHERFARHGEIALSSTLQRALRVGGRERGREREQLRELPR